MYAEDVDLCFKVRRAGWENVFVPDAVVTHHGGQSTRAQDDGNFSDIVLRESRLRFFQDHKGAVYAFCYRASTMAVAAARLLLLGGAWIASGAERRHSIRSSFRKWVRVLRWSVGMERWVLRMAEEHA
jgi:GT2 family glycosyltransferase